MGSKDIERIAANGPEFLKKQEEQLKKVRGIVENLTPGSTRAMILFVVEDRDRDDPDIPINIMSYSMGTEADIGQCAMSIMENHKEEVMVAFAKQAAETLKNTSDTEKPKAEKVPGEDNVFSFPGSNKPTLQ
jgi:hypothetical protein